MAPPIDDRYFLLSSLGIEQFIKGQSFPELLVTQVAGNTGARLLVSSEGNFVLGISDQINEYSGEWVQSTVIVYNRQTKYGFSLVIPREVGGEIPLAGFEKDQSAYKLIEQGSSLSVTEDEKEVLSIDLEKEQINILR